MSEKRTEDKHPDFSTSLVATHLVLCLIACSSLFSGHSQWIVGNDDDDDHNDEKNTHIVQTLFL